jgi:hypothetical protein
MDDQSTNASTEAMAGLTVEDKAEVETLEATGGVADNNDGDAAPAAST